MLKPILATAAVAVAALSLAACIKLPGPANNAAPAGGPPPAPIVAANQASGAPAAGPAASAASGHSYEGVVIPGSKSLVAGFFRINVSTGQTWQTWSNAPQQLTAIAESQTLPAGQYHLYAWSQPADADGNIAWGMMRFDFQSGRMWLLNGCGQNPCTWQEMTSPQ